MSDCTRGLCSIQLVRLLVYIPLIVCSSGCWEALYYDIGRYGGHGPPPGYEGQLISFKPEPGGVVLDDASFSKVLPSLRKLPALTLDVSETRVTDRSISLIATMVNLEELQCGHTAITADALRQLKGMPKLDTLVFSSDNISLNEGHKLAEYLGFPIVLPSDQFHTIGVTKDPERFPK